MKLNKFNLITKALLYFFSLNLLFQPLFVFAQLGEVPISHPGLGTGGIGGTVGSVAVKTALASVETANGRCQDAENIFGVANTAKGIAYGGLSLIGGSKTEVADLESHKKAIDGFINCRKGVKTALEAITPTNLYDGQTKQRISDDVNLALKTLDKLRLDVETQSKIAKRSLWKGIMLTVLLKTTKVVTQRLANKLITKYKINDVLQYADAVASQVYTAQLIHDRAVDNEEQLILRSIATNPLLRTKVHNSIYQRAADAVQLNGDVFSASGMTAGDPDFYLKLAQYGNPEANPAFMQTVYEGRAGEIKGAGIASANNEILMGSGLKAPRSCAGNVNEQKGIEQRWLQASDEMENRQKLLNDLQNSHIVLVANKQISEKDLAKLEADIAKAKKDLEQAALKLRAMPKSFESADGKKSLVFKTCELIASPAEAVDKGIDAAFKKFSDSIGDYNDNNLPFFMSWIGDIASNIADNLIFGGGGVKNALLSESSNLAQAINTGISFADAQVSKENLEKGINVSFSASGNTQGEFVIEWDIFNVDNASFITISGPGISDFRRTASGTLIINPITNLPELNKLSLSGSVAIKSPNGGSYQLNVYNQREQKLDKSATFSIPNPSVKGAKIVKNNIESPRGSVKESVR